MRKGSGAPTLGSVAERAAVSRQTVSNVINNPELVASETAARVRAVITELGYRPNRVARQLRTRQSQVIGLRVEQSNRISILDRFLHAVTDAANLVDNRLMLYTAHDDASEIEAIDELVGRWDVDGFVLTGSHAEDPRRSHLTAGAIPYVAFGRPWGADDDLWVDVDGAAGTRAATEHLIAGGHTLISFLGWPEGPGVGEDRLSGWRDAMHRAGLAEQRIFRCANDLTEGRRAAAAMLDAAGPVPTAVVCVSDALALGVLAELSARGLRPGQDLSVIGFDDTDVAGVIGLTSVAQPLVEAAQRCVKILLSAVHGEQTADRAALLTPRLVVRTTG